MYWDIRSVEPLDNYKLKVVRVDGLEGVLDMSPYLKKGVFRELENLDYFRQVGITYGAITWPNGQDIAPETVEQELKRSALLKVSEG
ncbi:DUF2442 domain-containing protein [Marinobacter metalliresistant]|uniref:DUF2442 domain-containing protein n=1 Tax=Marinobacter metalliresistant TaxID=2961995 RepID=A0ABZ2W4N9_9GAMM